MVKPLLGGTSLEVFQTYAKNAFVQRFAESLFILR